MNNRFIPIGVFLMLMLSSFFTGRYSFLQAQEVIAEDLNQALYETVKEKGYLLVCQDTIQAYRRLQTSSDEPILLAISDETFRKRLKYASLRKDAFISFELYDVRKGKHKLSSSAIHSDTLLIDAAHSGETVMLKGYSRPSFATIFSISDQRMSFSFAISALLWAMMSWLVLRRKGEVKDAKMIFGGLRYVAEENVFYGCHGIPIHFTPMQQQLMLLFWNNSSHSLSKDEICRALWPKKEDASDTLYTLMRRVKPLLEQHTQLKMTADRGKCYTLEISKLDDRQ